MGARDYPRPLPGSIMVPSLYAEDETVRAEVAWARERVGEDPRRLSQRPSHDAWRRERAVASRLHVGQECPYAPSTSRPGVPRNAVTPCLPLAGFTSPSGQNMA